jgi:hypothetical protein
MTMKPWIAVSGEIIFLECASIHNTAVDREILMYQISRAAGICVAFILCIINAAGAQENPPRAATTVANQNTYGLGSGGLPTPRRQAASQADTRWMNSIDTPNDLTETL